MHKTLSVSNPFVMCSDVDLLKGASLSFMLQIVFASRGQYGLLMAETACGCCRNLQILHHFFTKGKTGSDGLLLEVAHSLGKHQSRSSLHGCWETGHSSAPLSTRGLEQELGRERASELTEVQGLGPLFPLG